MGRRPREGSSSSQSKGEEAEAKGFGAHAGDPWVLPPPPAPAQSDPASPGLRGPRRLEPRLGPPGSAPSPSCSGDPRSLHAPLSPLSPEPPHPATSRRRDSGRVRPCSRGGCGPGRRTLTGGLFGGLVEVPNEAPMAMWRGEESGTEIQGLTAKARQSTNAQAGPPVTAGLPLGEDRCLSLVTGIGGPTGEPPASHGRGLAHTQTRWAGNGYSLSAERDTLTGDGAEARAGLEQTAWQRIQQGMLAPWPSATLRQVKEEHAGSPLGVPASLTRGPPSRPRSGPAGTRPHLVPWSTPSHTLNPCEGAAPGPLPGRDRGPRPGRSCPGSERSSEGSFSGHLCRASSEPRSAKRRRVWLCPDGGGTGTVRNARSADGGGHAAPLGPQHTPASAHIPLSLFLRTYLCYRNELEKIKKDSFLSNDFINIDGLNASREILRVTT